jgi:Uncharacterized protein conserved in bacteria (DUF2059)
MRLFERIHVMKALLVLVAIYVAAFLIAVQGSSQGSVEAAQQARGGAQSKGIDPAKETDIRSLMELVGARDTIQEATARSTEQIRESLVATVPGNDRGQQFIDSFVADYQKKFNPDGVTSRMIGIYDKHFSDEEIKGLLQFYGSPLGQKFAAEMPKITAETLAANRAEGTRVAREVLQDLQGEYPTIGAEARLSDQPRIVGGLRERRRQALAPQTETQASAVQP